MNICLPCAVCADFEVCKVLCFVKQLLLFRLQALEASISSFVLLAAFVLITSFDNKLFSAVLNLESDVRRKESKRGGRSKRHLK